MKLFKTLFLLISLQISMQAQDFPIMLGKDNFVQTILLTPKEMWVLKPDLKRMEDVKISGVSRRYEDKKGCIILEFYNEVGLKLEEAEDLVKLNNINFECDFNNKISYSKKLSKKEFSDILANTKTEETGKGFEFFGKFYTITGKEAILWEGEKYFSGQYSILSTLRGLDYELEHLLEKPEKDDRFLRSPDLKLEKDWKLFAIENGTQENVDLLVQDMSRLLNIDKEKIDFSVESLDIIEASLDWNTENFSIEYMMTLSSAYLAEMLIKHENFEWKEVNDHFGNTGYDLLYKGKSTLLQVYLHDSFIDSPLLQVKPAYLNTIAEVKRN